MGEIKSTLDLVMERTRHLTLSPEERRRQQEERFDQRVQGLLQRFADGALAVAGLTEAIAGLQAELGVADRRRVLAAVCARIAPDGDNHCWLDLLTAWSPTVRGHVEEALAAYMRRRDEAQQAAEAHWRDRLAHRFDITGTAVNPNAMRDSACRERLEALRQSTQQRLEEIGRISDPG